MPNQLNIQFFDTTVLLALVFSSSLFLNFSPNSLSLLRLEEGDVTSQRALTLDPARVSSPLGRHIPTLQLESIVSGRPVDRVCL